MADQLRSTSFRLGLAYATLFFLSVMTILGATYLAATYELEGVVRLGVDEDMAKLRTSFAESGGEGLLPEVRSAVASSSTGGFFLLTDDGGRFLAGNLPASLWVEGPSDRILPADVLGDVPERRLGVDPRADPEVRLLASGVHLGTARVMVGRDAHSLDETQEVILSALLWGTLPTTMLALLGGFVVSIGPTRRVDAIAQTMREVAGGDFRARLPVTVRKDELDRLSRDINGMLDRVETLMSSLKQVSTDIAHDLRTPLARLRQRLDRLHDDQISRGGDGVCAECAIAEVDSIIETFNALLRIAQIEAGARKAKFVRLDLSALLLQMHDVYETVAEESGFAFRLAPSEDLHVDGDRDLLQQLVANLVDNALTHVPSPGRISISAHRSGASVVLDVADDGPGIPQDERDKVFRRLYRLDRSRTTPGNGLGLALVAAVAELHGATVEAHDNRPGLRMTVTFPVARSEAKARPDDPRPEGRSTTSVARRESSHPIEDIRCA